VIGEGIDATVVYLSGAVAERDSDDQLLGENKQMTANYRSVDPTSTNLIATEFIYKATFEPKPQDGSSQRWGNCVPNCYL